MTRSARVPPASARGESLRLVVPCRTSRDPDVGATRHEVVVDADGALHTPHDVAAERVAVALGGYSSCVTLADRVIPAFDEWRRRQARTRPPRMSFAGGLDSWRVGICPCDRTPFRTGLDAAAHWREPRHIAEEHDVPLALLVPLTRACEDSYRSARRPLTMSTLVPRAEIARARHACASGLDGLTWLWDLGIRPAHVAQVAERLDLGALPAEVYLGILWTGVDPEVAARTLAGIDEPADEDTLPKAGGRRRPPPADSLRGWSGWAAANWDVVEPGRAAWAFLDVPRSVLRPLARAGYEAEDVRTIARGLGSTIPVAAITLGRWVGAGLSPTPAELAGLAIHGREPPAPPSMAAVERLRASLPAATWTDTQLALVLAEHGSVPAAVRALTPSS